MFNKYFTIISSLFSIPLATLEILECHKLLDWIQSNVAFQNPIQCGFSTTIGSFLLNIVVGPHFCGGVFAFNILGRWAVYAKAIWREMRSGQNLRCAGFIQSRNAGMEICTSVHHHAQVLLCQPRCGGKIWSSGSFSCTLHPSSQSRAGIYRNMCCRQKICRRMPWDQKANFLVNSIALY